MNTLIKFRLQFELDETNEDFVKKVLDVLSLYSENYFFLFHFFEFRKNEVGKDRLFFRQIYSDMTRERLVEEVLLFEKVKKTCIIEVEK